MRVGLLHILMSGSFLVSTTLNFCVACLFKLMKYVAGSPKVLVHFYQIARCHIPSSGFCFYWFCVTKTRKKWSITHKITVQNWLYINVLNTVGWQRWANTVSCGQPWFDICGFLYWVLGQRKYICTRESQELKKIIREVAGSVLVDLLLHVLNFVTTVCNT